MKAWKVKHLGAEVALTSQNLPIPAAGETLLRVTACALNHADLLMQSGRYQEKPTLPFTIGMEIAGVVEAHGPAANSAISPTTEIGADIAPNFAANNKSLGEPKRQIPPGTRVAAFIGHGGLAEAAIVPTDRLIVLPDAVDNAVGAAFQVAYGTSHLALDHKAKLRAGETLLVLGAAGGVGLTAVEIGKHMGAKVIAVARGADRLAAAQRAGADVLIDSNTPDLKAALRAAGGVDVVYDAVGGPDFMAALSATRPEGRLLTIGFAGGAVPQIPANLLLVKNLSVMGLYWGGYLTFAPQVLTQSLTQVLAWIAAGDLRPHVGATIPFDRADIGLAMLRDRTATGKVVIVL